jgi:hypothetical protein
LAASTLSRGGPASRPDGLNEGLSEAEIAAHTPMMQQDRIL